MTNGHSFKNRGIFSFFFLLSFFIFEIRGIDYPNHYFDTVIYADQTRIELVLKRDNNNNQFPQNQQITSLPQLKKNTLSFPHDIQHYIFSIDYSNCIVKEILSANKYSLTTMPLCLLNKSFIYHQSSSEEPPFFC